MAQRRPSSRGRVRLTALAATLPLLAACSVGSGESFSTGALRVVLSQEPPSLEPCDSSLTGTGVVVRSNITEPLAERNPSTGELEPLLSTGWTSSAGERTWTFELRDDVRFSDGSTFDAKDAVHSIDRAVNGDLACNVEGYVFGDTDLEAEAVDATTLRVTAPEADPILPLRLSFVEMVPEETDGEAKVRQSIGTGPYQVDSWRAGTKLSLSANPEYWGDAPDFDRVEYQWRGEGSVRAAMVERGEADVATNLGPEDGSEELTTTYPNNETAALRMQMEQPPLDDRRVREAIAYAVPRQALVDELYQGEGEVAAQLIPPGVVGHDDDLEPWPTDLPKAKQLLAEAEADGVDLSPQIRLVGRSGQFPLIDETIQVIQQQLSGLGLDVKIEMTDTLGTVALQERPFPQDSGPYLLMIQHGNQAGDGIFTMEQYYLSEGNQSAGGTTELDEMIESASQDTGEGRQTKLEEVFQTEPKTSTQFAFIAHQRATMALAPRVSYEPNSATGDEMRLAEFTRDQ